MIARITEKKAQKIQFSDRYNHVETTSPEMVAIVAVINICQMHFFVV